MASREDYGRHEQVDMLPLRSLQNWQVAEGDPDIRGWDLMDMNGDKIGQVHDLIINRRNGEAAYAEITSGGSLGVGGRNTLIPIDELRLDAGSKRVMCDYNAESLRTAPEYHEGDSNFSHYDGFWSGLMAAGDVQRQTVPEGQRQGVVQRFVQRMEGRRDVGPAGEATVPIEGAGGYVRKVRVHMAHRTQSGETPLNEGDILEIPVSGEGRKAQPLLDEIVIRLESVEEEEEEREEAYHRR